MSWSRGRGALLAIFNGVRGHLALVCLIGASLSALAGCTSQEARFQQQQERLESLTATAVAVAGAWLEGRTSGIYTRTALAQTFTGIEAARSGLASRPRALADSRGARLSQAFEHLARLVAALGNDVAARDAASARRHLSDITLTPPGQP